MRAKVQCEGVEVGEDPLDHLGGALLEGLQPGGLALLEVLSQVLHVGLDVGHVAGLVEGLLLVAEGVQDVVHLLDLLFLLLLGFTEGVAAADVDGLASLVQEGGLHLVATAVEHLGDGVGVGQDLGLAVVVGEDLHFCELL